jgi:hypothetical protein
VAFTFVDRGPPVGSRLGVTCRYRQNPVNPATGAISAIGATGLGFLALDTAELNGTAYETDFSNNLYRVNTATGALSLVPVIWAATRILFPLLSNQAAPRVWHSDS